MQFLLPTQQPRVQLRDLGPPELPKQHNQKQLLDARNNKELPQGIQLAEESVAALPADQEPRHPRKPGGPDPAEEPASSARRIHNTGWLACPGRGLPTHAPNQILVRLFPSAPKQWPFIPFLKHLYIEATIVVSNTLYHY